jgi:hypothetical protein
MEARQEGLQERQTKILSKLMVTAFGQDALSEDLKKLLQSLSRST